MSAAPLPRHVAAFLHVLVPPERRSEVLGDLAEEYGRLAGRSGRLAAGAWLSRETMSLAIAFLAAAVARGLRSLSVIARDVRVVRRAIGKRPLASLGAAAMLALGLLAVLVTTGLTSALLFKPISSQHGRAVERVGYVDRTGRTGLRLSFVELERIREGVAGTAAVGAANLQPVLVTVNRVDVHTLAEVVNSDYLPLVGAGVQLGRAFVATDDRQDAQPAVLISDTLWRSRFNRSPAALGATVELNGHAFAVVGVSSTSGSGSFLGASVDVWVPMAQADAILNRGWRTNVQDRWFHAVVLSADRAAELAARLDAVAADLARDVPDPWRDRRLITLPGMALLGSQRRAAVTLAAVLGGLSLLILTVAAANVSGVLLARAAGARRLAAVHLAMGAPRAVIARRQVLEGAALGLMGAALAIGLYVWVRTRFAEIALLPTLAVRLDLPLNALLVAVVASAALAAGALLAIGPAVWVARLDLADALREGSARATGGGLSRVRRLLVSVQVCLSLILIVTAGLFTRSLDALVTSDLGFPRERLVAVDFDVEPSGPVAMDLPALAREALDRTERLQGVVAAAMSNRAPIDSSTPAVEVAAGSGEARRLADVSFYLATARYFETVGVPIVAGRSFTRGETDSAADVAIVNETLARRLWPDGDALDRAMRLEPEGRSVRIVGIARDSRYRSISESGRPHVYLPTAPSFGRTLLVRTSGDARQALRDLQEALNEVGPGVVGFFPRTIDDHLAIELLPLRAAAGAASLLGGLALLLSAIGLYGIVSWFVEVRRREIGVRLALGATHGAVRWLVVRQAVRTAAPGMALGLLASAGIALAARSILYGIGPLHPGAYVTATAALAGIVLVASYLPGRRASLVDPVVALRSE